STIQRGKPPEWWEKQKGSRGIRRGQWYRLVFQFPIRALRKGQASAFYYGDPLGEMRLVSRVFEM
ncbi:hypothetical protein ACNAUN_25370, partial [Escherichia coli]|nr:hypothetical protein [Escherichia coli]MCV4476181.1 hypothetical protein [Escherichia coli]MCV5966451.1 hypothetical protein [Escherichia coli]MDZ2587607.1 hypothetical protein [Klebsiella pneumoniae]